MAVFLYTNVVSRTFSQSDLSPLYEPPSLKEYLYFYTRIFVPFTQENLRFNKRLLLYFGSFNKLNQQKGIKLSKMTSITPFSPLLSLFLFFSLKQQNGICGRIIINIWWYLGSIILINTSVSLAVCFDFCCCICHHLWNFPYIFTSVISKDISVLQRRKCNMLGWLLWSINIHISIMHQIGMSMWYPPYIAW